MNGYSIHKLKINEFELLIPLIKNCFGMDVDIHYFEWKFLKNPVGFVEGYYAKSSNGDIAAYYGVIPQLYSIVGKERIIYQSCDTMTHSEHRRKGLFQKLANHCYEELKKSGNLFVIGFSGEQSTPGFIKFGWKNVFTIRNYFFPKLLQTFFSSKSESVTIIENTKSIEHLTIKSNSNTTIHSVKRADIYQWRISNPLSKYTVIGTKGNNDQYDSYLTFIRQEKKIILFDLHITDKKSERDLFNYLISQIKKNHLGIIAFTQGNTDLSKLLRKRWFMINPFPFGPLSKSTPFIFLAENHELINYNHSEKWCVNAYDHDSM